MDVTERKMTNCEIAKIMWESYCARAGGVTFDGKPPPTWEELGEERQSCWEAAAEATTKATKYKALEREVTKMTDDVYVIILSNGRAENVAPGRNWYDILNQAEYDWRHSSSYSNNPEKLMKNGKIIVEKQLWNIANNYVLETKHLVDKAYKQAKEMFPEPKGE